MTKKYFWQKLKNKAFDLKALFFKRNFKQALK